MMYNTVTQIRSRCSSVCIPIRSRRFTSTGVFGGSVCDRGWRLIALECVVSNVCVGGGFANGETGMGDVYGGCEGDWLVLVKIRAYTYIHTHSLTCPNLNQPPPSLPHTLYTPLPIPISLLANPPPHTHTRYSLHTLMQSTSILYHTQTHQTHN
jgi:hypothetical protein